jgi:rhodanese-related sulfurtransferase
MKPKDDEKSGNKRRNVDNEGAQGLLKNPDLFLLDVRTAIEFQNRALKGAILIPVDRLNENLDLLPTDKDQPILVYCAHGVRSVTAQNILLREGYTKVFNLLGGLSAFLGIP